MLHQNPKTENRGARKGIDEDRLMGNYVHNTLKTY
ncbi:hypothetical protein ACJIZ3_002703 [Penstemon smallii]|uniref:Uncharacterized protein n=1 Tax=Penstemon smallii TaxID=265156 RepID=A0ABD3U7K8_9LAMI